MEPVNSAQRASLQQFGDGVHHSPLPTKVVDVENPEELEYGIERFSKLCSRYGQHEPDRLASPIEAELDTYVGGGLFIDDRTILVIRRCGAGPDEVGKC